MTPYEVFFFSSGAVEEKWTDARPRARTGPTCSSASRSAGCSRSASWRCAALVLQPRGIGVDHLSQVALPVTRGARQGRARADHRRASSRRRSAPRWRRASRRATRSRSTSAGSGASSCGRARRAGSTSSCSSRSCSRCCVALTAVDPVKVTEYSIVLSAAALPLTYFPILVVANDPDYMGDKVNGRFGNAIATVYSRDPRGRGRRHHPADDRHEGGTMSERHAASCAGRAPPARPPDRRPRRVDGRQGRRPRARARRRRRRSEPPVVTAILSGAGALAGQLEGRLGRWLEAIDARLS